MENKPEKDSEPEGYRIESSVFRISPLRFAALMSGIYGSGWLWLMIAFSVLAVVVGVSVDYRFFILAMMVVFIVMPMMLTVLYYRYGLKGECYVNVVSHKLLFEEGRLFVLIEPMPEYSDETEGRDSMQNEISDDAVGNGICEEDWKIIEYKAENFGRYTVGSDYVVFPFVAPLKGFLYIPANAFDSDLSFAEMVKSVAGASRN